MDIYKDNEKEKSIQTNEGVKSQTFKPANPYELKSDKLDASERKSKKAVCIFISQDMPGIMFTPTTVIDSTSGIEISDYYLANPSSIAYNIEWNENKNIPNGKLDVLYFNGNMEFTTYMVSEEKMKEILDMIKNSTNKDLPIEVDLRDMNNSKYINPNIYNSTFKDNKNSQYDNIYNNISNDTEKTNIDVNKNK